MESPHAGIAPLCADDVSREPQDGLSLFKAELQLFENLNRVQELSPGWGIAPHNTFKM